MSLGHFQCVERALAWIGRAEAGRARALASAGLEASRRAIATGGSGALGSPQDPVLLEEGALCVEASHLGPRALRLVATASVGVSRERIACVVELDPVR